MLEMLYEVIVHHPRERFNSAKPLLDPRDEPHDICQNIEPGTTTTDIYNDLAMPSYIQLQTRAEMEVLIICRYRIRYGLEVTLVSSR